MKKISNVGHFFISYTAFLNRNFVSGAIAYEALEVIWAQLKDSLAATLWPPDSFGMTPNARQFPNQKGRRLLFKRF